MNATTPADRARRQRRCAHTLATILETHRHLPVLVWTVTAAGVSARVLIVDAMHSALDQVTAWTTALGLHPADTTPPVSTAATCTPAASSTAPASPSPPSSTAPTDPDPPPGKE